ncbi:MAG: potassium channel protein [bacterium]|nr:potassium channel protein [bacterium]
MKSIAMSTGLAREELRAALRCLLLLSIVVAIGTVGFWYIESDNQWDLWKSLFFTLVTITTVGYGDQGLSPAGEKFAALMLLFGIGAATYSISSLVQIAVNYQSTWKRRMQGEIDLLRNHFIITGFGRIGRTVAKQLKEAGTPFVIIDQNAEIVEEAQNLGYLAMKGDSTEDDCLRLAAIQHAKGLICVTSSDSENVFVTLCATELNSSLFIASRANTDSSARKLKRAGASVIVSPFVTAGNNICDAILRPEFALFMDNKSDSFDLGELSLPESCSLIGQAIRSVGKRFPEVSFVGLKSTDAEKASRPAGNYELRSGDTLIVAGPREDVARLFRLINNNDVSLVCA